VNLKTLLRTGSAAAIAAALSFGAIPTIAHAAEPDGERRGHEMRADREGGGQARAEARQARQQQRAARAPQAAPEQHVQRAPVQQQRTYQSPVAQERSGRDWNRSDRRSATGAERSGRDWNRGSSAQVQAQVQAQAAARARAQAQVTGRSSGSRDWSQRRGDSGSTWQSNDGWQRNGSYTDRTRNQTYRDGRQQTQHYNGDGYRDGRNNRDGSQYRDRDRDHRSWSHDWRRDNRYNWYSYRNSNRNIYRMGQYYSPYSNYRYNRLSIGFRLGSLFYGSRYWINDPWQYRLPEAYGPYRWVRYYDDALLVDIYSGQVVDVIYDFFW
jgi:hypothetical protein